MPQPTTHMLLIHVHHSLTRTPGPCGWASPPLTHTAWTWARATQQPHQPHAANTHAPLPYPHSRSMRLGQSTLNPHGLDMDTDDAATESEGPGGYSPAALSYGSANTHGLLANPGNNIPEGG